MIDKDLIHNPQLWRLVLEVSDTELSAIALCSLEEGALQHSIAPIGGLTAAERLKNLENAVYDNPGLLVDYGMIDVLWRTPRFALLPGFVTDGEVAVEALHSQHCVDKSEPPQEVIHDLWPQLDVRLEYEVPQDMANFIRRTFVNPRMHHPLSPQVQWFASRHQGRGWGKMLVNLRPGGMDLTVLGTATPLLVNSFECVDPADAAYYILAVRQTLGLRQTDEVIIAGDGRRRAALTPMLKRFVAYVMPAIFPAELFRAGRGVLNCPFEQALTPLVYTSGNKE